MQDCIFCKIAKGELPSKKVYEDDDTLAFWDLNPKAPQHVLIITKKHIADILEMNAHPELMASVVNAVSEVTKIIGAQQNGFRTVTNTGRDSGQMVEHFHFHVLAGRKFGDDF